MPAITKAPAMYATLLLCVVAITLLAVIGNSAGQAVAENLLALTSVGTISFALACMHRSASTVFFSVAAALFLVSITFSLAVAL